MITETQKLKFIENLDTFFNVVNKDVNGETVEKMKQLEIWAVNVSNRYLYTTQGIKENMQLPKEHIEILAKKLEEQGLTLDEFVETKGRRSTIVKLLKEKKEKSKVQNNNANNYDKMAQTLETYTIEDLKKIRTKYDEEIVSLNQKYTLKYKKLYSLSDKKYDEIGKRLEIAKRSRRRINEVIENKIKTTEDELNIQLELPEEPEIIEIIETPEIAELPELPEQPKIVIVPEKKVVEPTTKVRKQKNANEKITELMKENTEKTAEIEELRRELTTQKETRQKDILTCQENYEKRLSEKKQELEEEYKKELERKTSMIELNYKREAKEAKEELETQKQALEEYKKQQEKELERQRKNLITNSKTTRELQKEEIVKLLCTQDNITIDDMKQKLETTKTPTEGLTIALKELRNEIPGITKKIKEDGKTQNYSINANANILLEEYKQSNVSPKISNIQDGTIEFIVRSDLHFSMTNSEETIKKIFNPYMEFCSQYNNIPIIDLGDLAETIVGISFKNWKEFDKNTIKQAYKFYRNYAKAISRAPKIKHYILLGNHDEHPYNAGIDPLEIMFGYSDNFTSLGVSQGSFKLGNDKIGVYHDKTWQNVVSYKKYSKNERDEYIYDYLCEEAEKIAKDYIYSLIGHYHFGKHNPEQNFSVINDGIESSLLFTAQVKDGYVQKMFVTELYSNGVQIKRSNYQTEIYNRGNTYQKHIEAK